ncbi:MAG: tetratricopeptide repeat protein [Alphaproteobacteria bacterium]|nr:tetratricopeptide repeat protein [Alphaproteobacteria bacterium]
MKKTLAAVLLAAFIPASAFAMGFGSSDDDATYDMGYEKAMDGDYDAAIDILKKVVKESPDNADAWNMLGFSYRNSGDADNAWDAYERALAINPSHKGAHEYIGEWYLMQGDVASAEAQLQKLETLCPSGCEEAETLAQSIEKAKSS